jgi:hypothetical protein
MQQAEILQKKRKYSQNKKLLSTHSNLMMDAYSLGAEYAVAKFFDLLPNKASSWNPADVGHWIDVKWSSSSKDLLIAKKPEQKEQKSKQRDPQNLCYALVYGKPWNFELVGWIGGAVACSGPLIQLKKGGHHNWVVKPDQLRQDWDTLKAIANSGPI